MFDTCTVATVHVSNKCGQYYLIMWMIMNWWHDMFMNYTKPKKFYFGETLSEKTLYWIVTYSNSYYLLQQSLVHNFGSN